MTANGLRTLAALALLTAGVVPVGSTALAADPQVDEDALFGGGDDDEGGEDATPRAEPDADDRSGLEDPLTIGGQVYLRLASTILDRGAAGDQSLSMPNLVDLYLDARPDSRVRAFFNGRLRYDPTIAPGATDAFGNGREAASVAVDQLWLKTDIARSVYLTFGQARIKWGASRLWNPTDFVNSTQREPLSLFDERTGVPMLKVHVPFEDLGWNAYALLLFDGVDQLDEIGAAFRLEMVFGDAEVTVSSIVGNTRRTSFGADLSTAIGPLDFTMEASVTDETDVTVYEGTLDFDTGTLPTPMLRDAWVVRASAGLQYLFNVNDNDLMAVGVEYFYNGGGVDDASIYPALLLGGDFQPFYLGEHYAALFWLIQGPGSWDDINFTVSALGNLSDTSFVTRLDMSARLHTRLSLEAYTQVHFGTRGGELRFALDVPDLPAIPGVTDQAVEAFSLPAPALTFGLNLRVSI